jgi:hypothetical protein
VVGADRFRQLLNQMTRETGTHCVLFVLTKYTGEQKQALGIAQIDGFTECLRNRYKMTRKVDYHERGKAHGCTRKYTD